MRWPLWLALVTLAVYLAFMFAWASGVHWFFYDLLPRETAVGLGGLICGVLLGHSWGQWSARREAKRAADGLLPLDVTTADNKRLD